MRIKVCWVGKTQNAPIKSLISDYLTRLSHMIPVEIVEIPDLSRKRGFKGNALRAAEAVEFERAMRPESRRIVLDERGKQLSSDEFAGWLETAQVRGTREMAFLIGGPEGIDQAFAEHSFFRLSLGKMTWTHEMARALLLEQLYRALCIIRSVPYHK